MNARFLMVFAIRERASYFFNEKGRLDMANNLDKLKAIQNALNAKYLERETQVEGMLVALLAQEHMLMVGPLGTAKMFVK